MNSTAKLGAFMLGALIILGVFILRIEQIRWTKGEERPIVQAVFPSVAGLDAKSAVRIAGVRVGIVEKIALEGARALVTLRIDPNVKLRQGASARVRSLGMLGEQFVELEPGPLGNPPLPAGTILTGASPTGFDQVLDSANGVAADVKSVTENFRRTLGGAEGERRIAEIVDNVRELTAAIKNMVNENRGELAATIGNMREFSQTLKTELPILAEKLGRLADGLDQMVAENRANIHDSLANVKDLTGRLRTSADNLNSISGKIDRGEGSIGKLVNDGTTVDNLNATLNSVQAGVDTLRNTIGRIEKWRVDMDMRAESLPSVSDSRSSFGFDLSTKDRRFFRVGVVDSPLGSSKTTTEYITTTLPDGTSTTITEKRVKESDAFTINAQVGYRLGGTSVRAGLFESHGGIGIDQYVWKDKLALTLEAFDFNREKKNPHLRFEGRYLWTKNIYSFAGYDAPPSRDRRSVLFGVGITWRDDDIKYLLGTASSLAGK